MGKTYRNEGSENDLEPSFSGASRWSRWERGRSKAHTRPLPNTLQMGNRITCNFAKVVEQFSGARPLLPMMVCGIYRRGDEIVAIDALRTSITIKKFYPSDLIISDQQVLDALNEQAAANVRIGANEIYTLPNEQDYFQDLNRVMFLGRLPENLWPDILVRRAHAVMYSTTSEHHCKNVDLRDPDIVREGYTLPIEPHSVLNSRAMAPDLSYYPCERRNCEDLNFEDLRKVVSFANTYTHQHWNTANIFQFPPSSEWPLDFKEDSLPDWTHRQTQHRKPRHSLD